MNTRPKFLNDFGVGWAMAVGGSAVVGAQYELTAVPMTAVGTLLGAIALALWPARSRFPLSFASISTTVASSGGRNGLSSALMIVALSPLWLPWVDALASTVATGSSSVLVGWATAAACGAMALLTALSLRLGHAHLSPRALLVAGLMMPLGVGTLLPALGAGWTGALAAIGLLLAEMGPPRAQSPASEEGGSQWGSIAAGLALTTLGLVHLSAVPWVSSDPFVIAWLGAGLAIGAAIGAVFGAQAAVLGAGLAAIGLAVGAELPPRLPAIASALLSAAEEDRPGVGYALPLIATAIVGLLVGLGVGMLKVRRVTGATGALLGLIAWQILPGVLGADEALHAAVALVAALALPVALSSTSTRSRLVGVLLPALAAASVLLAAPGPNNLLTEQAWSHLASTRSLEAAQGRASQQAVDVQADTYGRVAVGFYEGEPVAWQRGGRRIPLDAGSRHADRFLGHLPALLSAEPPRRILIEGLGRGETADAARQSSPGLVHIVEPSGAVRTLARRRLPVVSGLLADPAVRLGSLDVLSDGQWDAVIVDLREPWAFGAAGPVRARRLRAVRDALSPDGLAIIRVPLDALSPSELAAVGTRVGDVFPTVIAWLDPVDARHLVLTAWADERRPSVGTIVQAWRRDVVRADMRLAGLRSPADLLERAVTDRQGLALLGGGRRDAAGVAVVAAARARRGKASLPLAALATSGRAVKSMVSLDGMPPDEREALELRLESADASRASYLSLLGYLAEGKTKEAVGLAAQLADSSTDPARDLRALIAPWLRRGTALRIEGDLEKARAELSTAYAFSPGDVEVNLELARTLLALGKPDDAVAYVQRARDAEPTSVEPVLLLADVRVQQGRLSDAAEALTTAEPLFPTEVRLLVNLGYLLTQLGVGSEETVGRRLARARVLFQRAASLSPRLPQPRAGLAEVYYRLGDGEAALGEIQRALILSPTCQYKSYRGHILADLVRLKEAEASLQEAVLECPNLIDALVMLGAVSAEQGKVKEAREAWGRVVELDPTNGAARENLAILEASKLEEFIEQGRD